MGRARIVCHAASYTTIPCFVGPTTRAINVPFANSPSLGFWRSSCKTKMGTLRRQTEFLPKQIGALQERKISQAKQISRKYSSHTIAAMASEKFKKSSDLGFVRRHRNFQPSAENSYALTKDSLKASEWKGEKAIVGSLVSDSEAQIPLVLVISILPNGIFRVLVDDSKPTKYDRHVVKDVVLESCKPIAMDNSLSVQEEFAEVSIENQPVSLRAYYKPFHIDLIHTSDNKILLSLNKDSLLKIESFETKEDCGLKHNATDELGRWEETFKEFTDPKPRGPESIGLDVSFPFATSVHGLPERTTALDLPDTKSRSGTILTEPNRLYNLDVPGFDLDSPFGLYGSIPLLIARNQTQAAGFFWLNTSETYVDISSVDDGSKTSHWYSESGRLDTYLLSGPTVHDVFRQYLSLTGTPFMPQLFSLGYHQCRYSYMSEEDARSVNDGMDKNEIPYDVLWLDIDHTDGKRYFTWNPETYPDPTGLQKYIAEKGRKIVTIIDPHIKVDPTYAVHQMATENNLYVTDPHSNAFLGECWAGTSSYFDYSNEKTRKAWASRFTSENYPHFTPYLYVWNDMNEPSVFDGPEGTIPKYMLQNGVEHRHLHNVYGFDMARSTYAGLLAARDGTDRPFVLTRSFFAGSQRHCAVWTGDNLTEWGHLRSSVPMLLGLSVCGIAHCGADVGGFIGNPDGEFLARWYQVGAFQPFFRGHSDKSTKRREPWLFGEPYMSVIRDAIRARYEWLPFWYTLFAQLALRGGGPPMRPVWWEFGNGGNEEMWMIGESLLVAPVMREGERVHQVDLPEGVWYDLYGNRKLVEGKVELESGLDRMFVFLRGGRIVPKMMGQRRSSEEDGKYTMVVALDTAGRAEGELYVDDGKSYEHEKGKYMWRKFECRKEGEEILLQWETEGQYESLGEMDVVLMGMQKEPTKALQGDQELKIASDEDGTVTIANLSDETKGCLRLFL